MPNQLPEIKKSKTEWLKTEWLKIESKSIKCGNFIYGIFALACGMVAFFAAITWLVSNFKEAGPDALTLAQISATLGGFLLVGSVLEKAPNGQRSVVAWTAKSLLISALGFVLLGMILPEFQEFEGRSSEGRYYTALLYANAVGAAIAFAGMASGTVTLVWILPRIRFHSVISDN